jgi:hypothetical protein
LDKVLRGFTVCGYLESGIVRFVHIATTNYNYPTIGQYLAVCDQLGA